MSLCARVCKEGSGSCCPRVLTAGCAHGYCESSELGDAVNSFIPAALDTSDCVEVALEFCASARLVAPFFSADSRRGRRALLSIPSPLFYSLDSLIVTFCGFVLVYISNAWCKSGLKCN